MNLKIELKNVRTFEGVDGTGFNADIYINNIKCLHVHDDAWGSEYTYYDYGYKNKDVNKINHLIDEFDAYIASLPKIKVSSTEMPMNRDLFVYELFSDYQFYKRVKKFQKNSIIIGKPKSTTLLKITFKMPLNKIPILILQQEVNKCLREECTDGKKILNTNLTKLGIKL